MYKFPMKYNGVIVSNPQNKVERDESFKKSWSLKFLLHKNNKFIAI